MVPFRHRGGVNLLQPTEHTGQCVLSGLAQIRQTMYFASQLEPGYCASWHTSLLPEAANSRYVQGLSVRAAICAAGTHQLCESLSDPLTVPAGMLHFCMKLQICTV